MTYQYNKDYTDMVINTDHVHSKKVGIEDILLTLCGEDLPLAIQNSDFPSMFLFRGVVEKLVIELNLIYEKTGSGTVSTAWSWIGTGILVYMNGYKHLNV